MQQQETPMIRQYNEIKAHYNDAILFFRLGDFYEMFFDDALVASKILGIALTARNKNQETKVPLCGVPYHSASPYIHKLIEAGHKVAICEQTEDPKAAKGIVKREVIRVITPGCVIDSDSIEGSENNYLMSILPHDNLFGISYIDITTGEFKVSELSNPVLLLDELYKIKPRELLVPEILRKHVLFNELNKYTDCLFTFLDDPLGDSVEAKNTLKEYFKIVSLDSFGCNELSVGLQSARMILEYAQKTQHVPLSHITKLTPYSLENTLMLDEMTRKHLELTETIIEKTKKNTLLWVIDKTANPMGTRLLKKWLMHPLIDRNKILNRQDVVEYFVESFSLRKEAQKILKDMVDIERINGKLGNKNVTPRDLIALNNSLKEIEKMKTLLKDIQVDGIQTILSKFKIDISVVDLIDQSIADEPPLAVTEGGIIKKGFNPKLDELIDIVENGHSWLSNLEKNERTKSKIPSLKVKFNKVFGYYIEVTHTHKNKIPDYYITKQTLVNGERYFTEELKAFESKMLTAKEDRQTLEYEIFCTIRDKITIYITHLQAVAEGIAELDVFLSLAMLAEEEKYVRPVITDDDAIDIVAGRHPVIEKMNNISRFIPNDISFDCKNAQIVLLTGPNMSGKSTIMRQIAHIVILAHMGSFVPADKASIGLVDRIFTRVGASDNIALGESTFMVEMNEAAKILNNATKKSLIIMDEIGRGTSTFDGMSIAWAVCEYIHENIGAKTIFATHYHELTELANNFNRIRNYTVSVQEYNGEILFLRKLKEGAADKSYGIEVAKLAGIPLKVISRASTILDELEKDTIQKTHKKIKNALSVNHEVQLAIPFYETKNDTIKEMLKAIDLDNLSPLEALKKLFELKKEALKVE